jgi:uncharacterized protein (TIGR00369 family)
MSSPAETTETALSHDETIDRHGQFFQQLVTRDVPSPEGHLAVELDLRPELSNIRGSLNGGLICLLIDLCAGRLAYLLCDHENGYSNATSDLNVHFLSPVSVGPARVEARVLRAGRSTFVLHVDVTDVGRDNKLAAVSTISFSVVAPRS